MKLVRSVVYAFIFAFAHEKRAKVLKIFDIGKFLRWECVENIHFACNPPGYQLSME